MPAPASGEPRVYAGHELVLSLYKPSPVTGVSTSTQSTFLTCVVRKLCCKDLSSFLPSPLLFHPCDRCHHQGNLEKQKLIRVYDYSRMRVHRCGKVRQPAASGPKAGAGYVFSQPTLSDALAPARLHLLNPRKRHPLETECSHA